MNIKKIFTKIIATALSIVTFTGSLIAYADYKPLDHTALSFCETDSAECNRRLEYEIAQLHKLFDRPGFFTAEVSKNAQIEINSICLIIWLDVLIRFFAKYPQIKEDFITMTQEIGGNKFIIDSTDERETALAFFSKGYDNAIKINPNFYGSQHGIRDIYEYLKQDITYAKYFIPPHTDPLNIIAITAYHELGHLVQNVYIYDQIKSQHPFLIRSICDSTSSIAAHRRDRGVKLDECYCFSEPSDSFDFPCDKFHENTSGYDGLYDKIADEIKNYFMAKSDCPAEIIKYLVENPLEWFAEVFAQTVPLILQEKTLQFGYDATTATLPTRKTRLVSTMSTFLDRWREYLPRTMVWR